MTPGSLRVAIVGAGPVGLALALGWARSHPGITLSVYDGRPLAGADAPADDPRTLALSLGSVQTLQRLGAWNAAASASITHVHVSQQSAGAAGERGTRPESAVHLRAEALRVPQLGAVLGYDAVLRPLQQAWRAAGAREPTRLLGRFGTRVTAVLPVADAAAGAGEGGVDIDAGIVERHDLVVVAEGGVFGEQAVQRVRRGYGQTAWVGEVAFAHDAAPARGTAFERFTRHGPAALLPLPDSNDTTPRRRAALVWCVPTDADPVAGLDADARVALLAGVFHPDAGRIASVGPLKSFVLGLNAVPRLVHGRVVRIGNAAQALHPVAGQGLNLGLRDAAELARALSADALARHGLAGALARFERTRAVDRWSMMAATDLLARGFTWQWPGAHAVRGLGLAALERLRLPREALAQRMLFGGR